MHFLKLHFVGFLFRRKPTYVLTNIFCLYFIFDFKVVIRPMMYVALTYDHRLVDGREAVMFLRKIKAAVEDPRIVLAGL